MRRPVLSMFIDIHRVLAMSMRRGIVIRRGAHARHDGDHVVEVKLAHPHAVVELVHVLSLVSRLLVRVTVLSEPGDAVCHLRSAQPCE